MFSSLSDLNPSKLKDLRFLHSKNSEFISTTLFKFFRVTCSIDVQLKNVPVRNSTLLTFASSSFKSIREELIKDFELPAIKEEDDYNKNLLKEIESSNNPVFIHVRRDDYTKLGYSIALDYYRKAVEYIKSKVDNPTFFVFCAEDVDYIKNEFDIGVEYKLIGEKNKTQENFYENMRLMKACKHAIIANSSYSWWAAWLNECEDKIIIAPTPWLNNDDRIICENWIKIKV
jgi:hypothetical protein